MRETERKIELLAPGGSKEAIWAAVNAGADAVYAAGTMFGARAYADNPDEAGLIACIDHCHLHGVKLYLTVNTLVKEQELEEKLTGFLRPYYEAGLDAVLVQDLGVLRLIREAFPDLPVHASTQMSIQSAAGARQAAALGISRIVTARELSLEEIRHIYEATGIEIECFIHGALCYSYSGQCLMSSLIGGRSGNRGRCAQPCRKTYTLTDDARRRLSGAAPAYLLSLKDLSALELIPDLIEAGVASFKIEGRMKSPLYTAGVTAIYRKYIDLYLARGREGFHVEEGDLRALRGLFQKRGYCKGYYHVKNSPKMMAMTLPAQRHDMRGEAQTLALDQETLAGEKKEKIKGTFILRRDMPAILQVGTDGGNKARVRVRGQAPEAAQSRAVTAAEIEKQLKKTGDTPFVFDTLAIELEDGLFLPMGAVNRLRREALEALRQKILQGYRKMADPAAARGKDPERQSGESASAQAEVLSPGHEQGKSRPHLSALVSREEQLEPVLEQEAVGRVYLDSLLYLDQTVRPGAGAEAVRDGLLRELDKVKAAGKRCYLALPWTWRDDVRARFQGLFTETVLGGFDGLLVRCFDQLGDYAGQGLTLQTDANVYVWNHRAGQTLQDLGVSAFTLPAELNLREIGALTRAARGPFEISIYGWQQSMLTAQCLRKNTVGCDKIPAVMYLQDERQARFPVMNHCGACMNVIYNALPLDLTDMTEALRRAGADAFRLSFTVESAEQTRQVLARCGAGAHTQHFTRGHIRRGVE